MIFTFSVKKTYQIIWNPFSFSVLDNYQSPCISTLQKSAPAAKYGQEVRSAYVYCRICIFDSRRKNNLKFLVIGQGFPQEVKGRGSKAKLMGSFLARGGYRGGIILGKSCNEYNFNLIAVI